jgi:16S rRNA processing protein RimM
VNAVQLGHVVKAVGMRGEVKLRASGDFWEAALGGSPLELVGAGTARSVEVASHRAQGPDIWVLHFRDVADRDAAEALVGLELVLRDDAGVEPPGGLRPFQVRGFRCLLPDGEVLGVVEDLMAMPAHDVLVVRSGERTHWIPAVEPILLAVDFDRGEVRIDPPAGLLEI